MYINRALASVRESLGFAPQPQGDIEMAAAPAVAAAVEAENGLKGDAKTRVEETMKTCGSLSFPLLL